MSQISNEKLTNDGSLPLLHQSNIDDSSFENFFKENFSGLCVFCQYKFGFDLDVAKEAVHTGFIKLWENRSSISPDLSVKAYLYRIITNVCFDILRHEKVKQKHEKHVLKTSAARLNKSHPDVVEFNELRNNVDKALSELPVQMRKIFELSRYEGLKYAEIAEKLSLSVKTVETQISRALVKLRKKLCDYLPIYLLPVMFLLGLV